MKSQTWMDEFFNASIRVLESRIEALKEAGLEMPELEETYKFFKRVVSIGNVGFCPYDKPTILLTPEETCLRVETIRRVSKIVTTFDYTQYMGPCILDGSETDTNFNYADVNPITLKPLPLMRSWDWTAFHSEGWANLLIDVYNYYLLVLF